MATEQRWGRKESIIWPPRGFYYTWGAVFLALVFTGFLIYLRFSFGLEPLERYYLPYYLRSEMTIRPTAKFQLLYVGDGKRWRLALPDDVKGGETPQASGKPLPIEISEQGSERRRTLADPGAGTSLCGQRRSSVPESVCLRGSHGVAAVLHAGLLRRPRSLAWPAVHATQGY